MKLLKQILLSNICSRSFTAYTFNHSPLSLSRHATSSCLLCGVAKLCSYPCSRCSCINGSEAAFSFAHTHSLWSVVGLSCFRIQEEGRQERCDVLCLRKGCIAEESEIAETRREEISEISEKPSGGRLRACCNQDLAHAHSCGLSKYI